MLQNTHFRLIFGSLFGLLFFCLGCQTNELKAYEKLKVGMDKGEVLGIMGSPQWSERWHGQDRWSYRFYHQGEALEKEVLFMDGKASYVGEKQKPVVSAEEQDAKNETENRALEEKWARERIEFRAQSNKFLNDEPAQQQIRYVPQFVPMK